MAEPVNDTPSIAEMRLLRRLRTLTSGAHLCIINVDTVGTFAISFIGNGKLEKIRRVGEVIETATPSHPSQEQ